MGVKRERSVDTAAQQMLRVAEKEGIQTSWDRWDAMQPQCGFGSLGICCRICNMGPCRVDPFGKGPKVGVCGANADTIAARNLIRMIAAGSAGHSDHGRSIVHALALAASGDAKDYQIKDEMKLQAIAQEYGIATKGLSVQKVAEKVAEVAFHEYGSQHGELIFAHRAPEKRQQIWREKGVMPGGIDREVVNLMNITLMGVDNDYKSVITHGIRAALANGWGGSMIATEFSDILFGSPSPVRAEVNLGILTGV